MGEYYSISADAQFINLAKRPPLSPPTIAYADDSSRFNSLKSPYYQFRYRYIFYDFSIGSCSQISELSIPNAFLAKNNRIDITVNSGHVTVAKVQILVRVGNGISSGGEENPEWYIFNTIDKAQDGVSDNTPVVVSFLGSEPREIVSRIDTDVNFYSVPQQRVYFRIY